MKMKSLIKRGMIDWVKLPVNLVSDDRVAELMARKGMLGLGVYFRIVLEMYHRRSRCLTVIQLKEFRLKGATEKTVMQVVEDFQLFRKDKYGHIYSMIDFLGFGDEDSSVEDEDSCSENEESCPEAESDLNPIAIRFESDASPIPARINRDKDRDNILLEGEAAEQRAGEGEVRSPEERAGEYIRQLKMADEWAELTMMKSGFSQLLLRSWTQALEEFRRHVVVNRTAESIHDVECAKQYFSRYVTNATTGAQLRKALEEYERTQQGSSPYSHEDRNSAPGHRSYHGFPLPDDAPPRPDEQSEWDYEEHCWTCCRHAQEDKYATEQF